MSKNTIKSSKPNRPAPEAAPEATAAPPKLTREEKRALFATYEAADVDVSLAEKQAEDLVKAAKQRRGETVRAIVEALGTGPFDYNGKQLSVVSAIRKIGEGDDAHEVKEYSFKSFRKAAEKI